MRQRLKTRELHSSDMDNFLYTLSTQLEKVHKNDILANISVPITTTTSPPPSKTQANITTAKGSKLAKIHSIPPKIDERKEMDVGQGNMNITNGIISGAQNNKDNDILDESKMSERHQRSLSTHIRSLNISQLETENNNNNNNNNRIIRVLSFSDALLYDLHKRKKRIKVLLSNPNSTFKHYFRIDKSLTNVNPCALPVPKETVVLFQMYCLVCWHLFFF